MDIIHGMYRPYFRHTKAPIRTTEVCRLVVTNLRRKSAHALTFGGDFELKFRACANSRREICDNQPANLCTSAVNYMLAVDVLMLVQTAAMGLSNWRDTHLRCVWTGHHGHGGGGGG